MTVRPIIFSGPMVRALLEGSKTQTRRVIKPQPLGNWEYQGLNVHGDGLFYPADCLDADGNYMAHGDPEGVYAEWDGISKIRFAPGDLLYLRESFCPSVDEDYTVLKGDRVLYGADPDAKNPTNWASGQVARFRPSIHMPRWASRITLEVTGVKVERLQDITDADAVSEGVSGWKEGTYNWQWADPARSRNYFPERCPRDSFAGLWKSLNAKRGCGWDTNPWIIAVTFKTHKCNVDQMEKAA